MILATYNLENLFERAAALNLETWADGKEILEDCTRLNTLIARPTYTGAVKAQILKIMGKPTYRGLLSNGTSKFIRLNDVRNKLLRRPKGKPPEIAVDGRRDWIGWFELVREQIDEAAIDNTARIVGLLKADVQCVVEAEDRPGLVHFNKDVLPRVGEAPFDQVMLIDGNDDRGIDVGIMSRGGHVIDELRSHVHDSDAKGTIFSRDCAEYEITTAKGNTLLLLVNHFKSKGYGNPADSNAKRLRQAQRTRVIYDDRIKGGYDLVAVLGDLNETPEGEPLAPLVGDKILTDIMAHPKFTGDSRPGTHGNGTKSSKLDYILMSPKLSKSVKAGGIERRGVWGGKDGTLFPHLPTIKTSADAASDHAALWVELDV